jgi:sugar O-acyltransferase (sialic acid O-acetyltransferase NeuD family)
MANKLVIFGSGDMAELAQYYFNNDSHYDVVAFTVDADFLTDVTSFGLPVVSFETLSSSYPPDEYDLFIALSYSKLNQLRKDRYLSALAMGYSLASYISSKATVLHDGVIGDNCFILEDNTIQPFVKIGNNVTLWSGNHIGHHSTIADHTFLASHIVVSGGVEIGEQCFIGVNATLRDHIKIGNRCVIGAGVLLLSSAEDESLYIGSAAQKSTRSTSQLKRI